MTKEIDFERFPPQKALENIKGYASGNCFLGVCAVSAWEHCVVAIIAPDFDMLAYAWDLISPLPLQKEGVQQVAIFSRDDMTPNGEANRAPL
ncbi:MAG: hypothetical protein M1608_02850 [Candidatus Omnitrophica bacterium]|nr:hypothetical protein [Candidatus Omnitrophota bacterium]